MRIIVRAPRSGKLAEAILGIHKELMMSAMLEEAHKALTAMSVAANAIKDEEWGEAERALITVQEFVARLLRVVGDKTQEEMLAPKPEKGDRGGEEGPVSPGQASS